MIRRANSRKASNRRSTLHRLERLESRLLLSSFSNADLNGVVTIATMNSRGTAVLDGNGNVVGGSEIKDDGTSDVPTGTYSIAADGTFTIPDNNPKVGAMNSSKNVVAFSSSTPNHLGLIVSGGSASFSNADLNGTWYEFDNGDSSPPDNPPLDYSDNSGHAAIVFNGKGGLTYTHTEDETDKTDTGTGTYTVSPSGAFNVLINPTSGNPIKFTGALNSSKDVVATSQTDLVAAAAKNDSRMLVLVQPSGTYSNVDMMGNWTLISDSGQGTLSFDGVGNIFGTFNDFSNGTGPQAENVSGTYSVAADGSFTASPTLTFGTFTDTSQISGHINASRNVAFFDQPNSGEKGLDDLGILISSTTPLGATVSLSASAIAVTPTQGVTLTATVTPVRSVNNTPGGTVTFLDGETNLGTANVLKDGTATITATSLTVGTHTFTASYSGDTSFTPGNSNPASVLVTIPETVGGLDPSFGTSGRATHEVGFASTGSSAQDGAQSVIIGTVGTAPNESFGLTRFNADGSLDSFFGGGGVVSASFGATDDQATAVAVLPGGQILVAGTATTYVDGIASGSQFAVAEYNADGSLNTAFGGGTGEVLLSFSNTAGVLSNDQLHAMVIGAGGVIYLGGSSDAGGTGQDFALAALNSDGSPVGAFGSGGKALLDFSGGDDALAALALQADGEIVAGGSATAGGVVAVGLADFLPSGALNTRFGTGGKIIANVRNVDDQATSLVIQPKGLIVVGGLSATGSAAAGTLSADFLLQRYTPLGKLDRTFAGGTVITSFGQPAIITNLLMQPGGQIVASGKTTASLLSLVPSQLDVAVARYTPNGTLDTTFNGNGKAIVSLASGSVTAAPASVVRLSRFLPLDDSTNLQQAFADLIASGQAALSTNSGGELLIAGNSDTATVQVAIVTSGIDLVTHVVSPPPAAVIGGAKGMISVQLQDSGTQMVGGSMTIHLMVSTNAGGGGAIAIGSFAEKISLKASKAKVFKLKFNYPVSLPNGNYFVIATLDTGTQHDLNIINNTGASASAVVIAAPFVHLAASNLSLAGALGAGKLVTITFTLANDGNMPSKGAISLQFFASPDESTADATSIVTLPAVAVSLKSRSSKLFHQKVTVPANLTLPAGTYHLLMIFDSANSLGALDTTALTNNLLVGVGTFVV